ncbi:MAG: Ppx/GppA family phosphatase, partial [Pseudomonadota bacterium]
MRSEERRAVVDIGSNSVRLVIYEGSARAPAVICNEKALCGLGRDMTADGALNPDAAQAALATLARFARLLQAHGSPPTYVLATAAVREASDGGRFVDAVKSFGFDVQVLSGAQEAELAAYGVVSFEPDATGIVGDMGGGSLELIALKNGDIKDAASLSIGPLTVMAQSGGDMARARKIIQAGVDRVAWIEKRQSKTLYSVGGAWRAVAKIHMRLRKYPLSVLHRYEMTRAQVFDICELISRQSRQSLVEIPGIPRRRIDTLPYAAIVLKTVIERAGVEKIVVSSGGVREGILYRELSPADRKEDPLLAAAAFYARKLSPDPAFGAAAYEVIAPLFPDDNARQQRVTYAAALMIDVGAYFHPDHRARQAFDTALRAPLVGVSHEDRVAIALMLYRRHNGRMEDLAQEQVVGLLPWDEQQRITRAGLAMRFVASLSPKASAPLEGCRLYRRDGELIFHAPADRAVFMGETPTKR